MNFDNPVWPSAEQDRPDSRFDTARGSEPPEPLPEPWPPTGEYLTQAEMQEFLDTLAELLHRMVDICTALARKPGETSYN